MAKKQHTALTWITSEAKRLRKKYPRRFKTWTQYVAQASAIYSSKHGGHSPVGKKKIMRKKKRVIHRRKTRRKVGKAESGVSTRSRTHTDYNRNKVNITVGAVNKHKNAAKEKLLLLIGKEEVNKFKARLKRVRNKIAKKIQKHKADYRRLCQ